MKVITCFSYKGGAGRTTAAANIAAALASVSENVGSIKKPINRKVALIDLDVFSAGTHRVFEVSNDQIMEQFKDPCIQDYLREQMAPADYVDRGSIKLGHSFMARFRDRGAANNCRPDFTIFPAKPDPGARFVVQKQHENVLLELLMELESSDRGYDYVILDGESGIRQMADIAVRLADAVLMFFRLTWQHIEGTLNTANEFEEQLRIKKPFYLIPTCVPLIGDKDNVYRDDAPGLADLVELTSRIPKASTLDDYAHQHRAGAGYFWDGPNGKGDRLCIHDSLCLKGEERVIVFDTDARRDRAAEDFYRIAVELDRLLHGPAN